MWLLTSLSGCLELIHEGVRRADGLLFLVLATAADAGGQDQDQHGKYDDDKNDTVISDTIAFFRVLCHIAFSFVIIRYECALLLPVPRGFRISYRFIIAQK